MIRKITLITDDNVQEVLTFHDSEALWLSIEDKQAILYQIAMLHRNYLEAKNRHTVKEIKEMRFRMILCDMYGRIEAKIDMVATIMPYKEDER